MSSTDCLVVGAGPTGLVAAAELCRYGLSVRVVDKLTGPSPLSRAIALQARTLEILDEMGAAEPMVEAGLPLMGATLYSGREPIASLGFEELESRYRFLLSTPQCETERVLQELLARRGGAVERGVELTGFQQGDEGVTAALQRADGHTETVEARWLIGCDGAHSSVRKALGLHFEGAAYPDNFLLADVRIDWEMARDRIATFFSGDGLLACFPLPGGRWRLIASNAPATGETPTLAELQQLTDVRSGFPMVLSDAVWIANFRINSRQVSRYRDRRVFLAGDAAHIHSPVGGQGMNTGMQDAHNLAWKLAQVTRGSAPPALLDSYQAERHQVGRALLRNTDLATRAGLLRRPIARAVRDHVARYLSSLEVVQRRISRNLAELSLSYSGSPIVDEHQDPLLRARLGADESDESPTLAAHRRFAAGPRAGERAPDAQVMDRGAPRALSTLLGDGRYTVLLFDGRARTDEGYRNLSHIVAALEARWPGSVRSFVIAAGSEPLSWQGPLGRVLSDPDGDAEDAYGATAECCYIVRPDLYIGHRSQPASLPRVLAHLERVLVVRSEGRAGG